MMKEFFTFDERIKEASKKALEKANKQGCYQRHLRYPVTLVFIASSVPVDKQQYDRNRRDNSERVQKRQKHIVCRGCFGTVDGVKKNVRAVPDDRRLGNKSVCTLPDYLSAAEKILAENFQIAYFIAQINVDKRKRKTQDKYDHRGGLVVGVRYVSFIYSAKRKQTYEYRK